MRELDSFSRDSKASSPQATSNSLRARWAREPWLSLGPRVHKYLLKGRRLEKLEIPVHDGLLDLRGLPFPRRGRWGTFPWIPETQPLTFDLPVDEGLKPAFKDATLDHIDLTFADLEDTIWENSVFRDVRADSANVSHSVFSGCLFEDVTFVKTNLYWSVLGGFTGYETNTFRRTSFVRADLRHTVYRFPLFEDCDFSRAKFASVNFDASRFVRCKFAGKLHGTEFRESYQVWYETGREREYFERRGITPRDIRNPMQDVDFSEADLDGVTFWGCDLSKCRLPSDDKHLIVPVPRLLCERAQAALERDWSGDERDEALALLDLLIGPGDRWLKSLEVQQRTGALSEQAQTGLQQERDRMDKPWHWRATRPVVLTRGLFETKSQPWGGRLFDLLISISGDR